MNHLAGGLVREFPAFELGLDALRELGIAGRVVVDEHVGDRAVLQHPPKVNLTRRLRVATQAGVVARIDLPAVVLDRATDGLVRW
jgi:hypothetical protein